MKVLFINPQGNFDNKDSHWTEHPDFGGQLVYVKEVALSLAKLGVEVDIVTRKIKDEAFPEFYKDVETYHGDERVRVVRIPFGGDKFLNKEQLWPYLSTEFVDNIIKFYEKEGKKPDAITSHYGDGGLTAAVLSKKWGIPFTFTAHSLGAQKMDKMGVTPDNIEEFDKKYNFTKRIEAERIAMGNSAVNIVSTEQERFQQYSHKLYEGAVDVNNDKKFKVIPPGVNTEVFTPDAKPIDKENKLYLDSMIERDIEAARVDLPCIVLASRLEIKKNHKGAVLAYASDKNLQEKANLVITLRGVKNAFEDYSFLKEGEREILDDIMAIIDQNDLRGKISIFSVDGQEKLSSTYRLLAAKKSVFCLTAFYEPFGLAPIEAMHCGLAAAVTQNGGPFEITDNGKFGVLVDPEDTKSIAQGMSNAIDNFEKYSSLGIKRVEDKYTWRITAKSYLAAIQENLSSL